MSSDGGLNTLRRGTAETAKSLKTAKHTYFNQNKTQKQCYCKRLCSESFPKLKAGQCMNHFSAKHNESIFKSIRYRKQNDVENFFRLDSSVALRLGVHPWQVNILSTKRSGEINSDLRRRNLSPPVRVQSNGDCFECISQQPQ